MENNLNILLNCETFDYNVLLQKYNEKESGSEFNLNEFKIFIEKFNKKANKFEEKTGVPKKYFISKLNLSIMEKNVLLVMQRLKIFMYILMIMIMLFF